MTCLKNVYSIGEFCELFGLNVQTLRYYDSIGLFKPCGRDEKNGRRSYEFDQVYGLACIRFLRRMGYSLQEIQGFLKRRTGDTALDFLEQRAQELSSQAEALKRIETALRRKIRFTGAALQELETLGGPGSIAVRCFPKRYCIPIGGEEILYEDEFFYLYPTAVFYEEGRKTFGAYLHEEEAAAEVLAAGPKVAEIPAGSYLCGYHVGPYENVAEAHERMRSAFPQLNLSGQVIDFNIIDQFVECDSAHYTTAVQIGILE